MSALTTSRVLAAPVDQVYAAFRSPERLARWWGPEGFTNTFEVCEFKSGGRWRYVMHGPDGKDYPNESVFAEVLPPGRIVIEHTSLPTYKLTITLTSMGPDTQIEWSQVFDNEAFVSKMRDFLLKANGQNLDRLTAEVRRSTHF